MSDITGKDRGNEVNDLGLTRRTFLQGSAAVAAATIVPGWLGASAYAQGGDSGLKIALVGCGGRGRGALANAIEAAEALGIGLTCVAVCDYFPNRAQSAGESNGVPKEMQFVGPSGYKQLMQTDADIVILATPPSFRPVHLEAAVNAGKHVFIEKPVAVDPPGCRKVMSMGELAESKGLNIVAGTHRRHDADYKKHAQAVHDGAIGTILNGQIYWCAGRLWYRTRNEGESAADYMIRNWVSFSELSGDHIVEQHVHQIDLANWFIGRTPVSAVGFGSRQRRVTGNQYDNFSIQYDYGDGCVIQSMCRQINDCWNRVAASFTGTEGRVWDNRRIIRNDRTKVALADIEGHEKAFTQEHIALQQAIISGERINQAQDVAASTLTAVMGRISAYSGEMVKWDDVMHDKSSAWYDLSLAASPQDYEAGTVVLPEEDIAPMPGA